ncbi:hypothetical protein EDB80DRAFT_717882, partial [Ilyonectria destructans]
MGLFVRSSALVPMEAPAVLVVNWAATPGLLRADSRTGCSSLTFGFLKTDKGIVVPWRTRGTQATGSTMYRYPVTACPSALAEALRSGMTMRRGRLPKALGLMPKTFRSSLDERPKPSASASGGFTLPSFESSKSIGSVLDRSTSARRLVEGAMVERGWKRWRWEGMLTRTVGKEEA